MITATKPLATPPARLEFWFDFASTYSYLAAQRIGPLAEVAGVTVEWKPFLLGPAFTAMGWNDSPFNIYPAKGRYMWRDLERLCAKQGLPLQQPSQFPRNGLLPARIGCAHADAAWLPAFVRNVFAANFAEDRDIGDRQVIGEILAALGLDLAAIIASAEEADSKNRLRLQTEQAVSLGIFGAPSFLVAGELFWGNDRLEDALAWAQRPAL